MTGYCSNCKSIVTTDRHGLCRKCLRPTKPTYFIFLFVWVLLFQDVGFCEILRASYYTKESALKEGGSGITANGEALKDAAQTCAHPSLPFGTILKIKNPKNGRWYYARVNDRGPAKWTKNKIDLTKKGFELLGISHHQGVANLDVSIIRRPKK